MQEPVQKIFVPEHLCVMFEADKLQPFEHYKTQVIIQKAENKSADEPVHKKYRKQTNGYQ